MRSRTSLILVLALAALAAFLLWGNVPAGVRAVESVLFPVFHKATIDRYAGVYKEDPLFVTAVIKVESNFLQKARSARGAMGLMQLMPGTAREIAQELKVPGFDPGQLDDPEINIRFGFHHLAKLRKEFGDDATVLAAYNAGGKNVRDWLKESGKRSLEPGDIQFGETRRFVQEVTATYRWLKRLRGLRNRLLRKDSHG